jgi:hypothetical protein
LTGSSEPTYYAADEALARSYWDAVGWALQYGIKVYYPNSGGQMKALGDLRDEIRAHRAQQAERERLDYIDRRSSGLDYLMDHWSPR